MLIRKQFKFNNMHIVRNCSSERCKRSLHSHTYSIEVIITANGLDHGQMLMDFGLFKPTIGEFIKSFDNSYTIWGSEPESFKQLISNEYPRYIETPTSPSAEALSIMFFYVIDKIIKNTQFNNGESAPELKSVRVHETTSGWAESFREDLNWWKYNLDDMAISDAIVQSWKDPQFWNNLKNGVKYVNPVVDIQIPVTGTENTPVQLELV